MRKLIFLISICNGMQYAQSHSISVAFDPITDCSGMVEMCVKNATCIFMISSIVKLIEFFLLLLRRR